jgi:diguanylate cyclase (GGDEF)-like protein/PAS domain S-box-containing protein
MNSQAENASTNSDAPAAAIAGGQTQRVSGSAPEVALHDQLYRYAEDLQMLLERHSTLENRYETLHESYARLDESRDVLEEVVQSSRDIHIVTDAAGTILQANPAAATLAPPQRLAGDALADWVVPVCRETFQGLLLRVVEGSGNLDYECELRLRREDAEQPPLIVSVQALAVVKADRIGQLHWIFRDITDLREQEFETQVSTMVFRNTAEGVMITDVAGEILAVNPAFTRITGYSAEEAIGRNPSLLKSGVQDAHFYAEFWAALVEKGTWQGELYNRKKNGEIYAEWLTISAAHDSDGRVLSYIAVFSDLSRLLQAEKKLSYLAHHDSLTGLPNRLLLQDRLAQTLAQARRSGAPFSLIFIDLDRFKQINDSLGHEVGDAVLVETGNRLVAVVREMDTVARIGGDEFVVLAPGLSGAENVALVCDKIIDAFCRPIMVDDHELYIGGSLGCAEYPRDGENEVDLLKHADMAMYRAKSSGGNTFTVYEQWQGDDDGQLRMESELRRAMERGQLRLEYQPQVAAVDGSMLGVEALLRWDHPRLGNVSPAQFIPIAEEIGLIIPIGAWVFASACKQLAAWDAQGLPAMTMAVNVSPRQLRDQGFIEAVKDALASSGISPRRLELEVTEEEVMFHYDAAFCKLGPLREMGVKIAIDDFGTGYSSLAHLLNLPIDRLKIDRSFVSQLERDGDPRAAAISASIVSMGRALGLELVAEGVENPAQLDLLTHQGCNVIQGFLTGRPMRPEALAEWLQHQPD